MTKVNPVKYYRIMKGLTGKKLAELAGAKVGVLRNFESGIGLMSANIESVAKILGITLEEAIKPYVELDLNQYSKFEQKQYTMKYPLAAAAEKYAVDNYLNIEEVTGNVKREEINRFLKMSLGVKNSARG